MERQKLDYNNCRVMRCFKKDSEGYIDIPVSGGTNSETRTAILKHADALYYQSMYPGHGLGLGGGHVFTKYDYYILLHRDNDIVIDDAPMADDNGGVMYYGGDRNNKNICYFDKDMKLIKTQKAKLR